MPSRCASSSIRASTTSRFGTNPSRYSCRLSVTSTVLIPPPHELVEQRLEGDDVGRHAPHRGMRHPGVQSRRRHRLVEASPAPVPRLELRARKQRLDLDHPRPEEVERRLVVRRRRLEVQPDLQPTRTGVVPGLVVEGGLAEVHLHEPAAASGRAEAPQLGRQTLLEALAELGEEVGGSEHHQWTRWGLTPDSFRPSPGASLPNASQASHAMEGARGGSLPPSRKFFVSCVAHWRTYRRSSRTKAAIASAPSTSTRGCSRTGSSSSAGRSTTWSPTSSSPSSCTWPPTTPRRRSRSTSTRREAPSQRASPSTTPCSTSRRRSRPSASAALPASAPSS